VYKVLYDHPIVKRNEVNLFIARGVHTKVKLGKRVDWSTLKALGEKVKIPTPDNGFIPIGVRKYPQGGLGKIKTMVEPPDTYVTTDSDTDTDSDGSHTPPSPLSHRAQLCAKRRRAQPLTINEALDDMLVAEEDEPMAGIVDATTVDTITNLKTELEENRTEMRVLYEDTHKLNEELKVKNNLIAQQQHDMDDLRRTLEAATMTNEGRDRQGEVQGLAPISQPPTQEIQAGVSISTPNDSLSFGELRTSIDVPLVEELEDVANHNNKELTDLRAKNVILKGCLHEVLEQYYQWKLACIFTVDRTWQMTKEFQKISNNYMENNQEKVFSLTSWPNVDDLFNMETMATKTTSGEHTIIDWSQHNFDFEYQISVALDKEGNPMLL